MATRIPRKLSYQIDEACQRWGISALEAAAFIAERRLRLSAVVASLPVIEGICKDGGEGGPNQIPLGRRRVTGLADLHPEDAWAILRFGQHEIGWRTTEPDSYLEASDYSDPDWLLTARRDEIGVRHDEMVRFEAAEALVHEEPEPVAGRGRHQGRPHRRHRGLKDRRPVAVTDGFRQTGRGVRCARRYVRVGHAVNSPCWSLPPFRRSSTGGSRPG